MTLQIILLLLSLTVCHSAKLLMFPLNLNSHLIYFGHLAAGLTDEGHNVSILVASNSKVPDWLQEKVNIITYQVDDPVPYGNSEEGNSLLVRAATTESMVELLSVWQKMDQKIETAWAGDCEAVMGDEELVSRIEQNKYDIAIMDIVSIACSFTLPYKLGLPYAVFGIPYSRWLFRIPVLPSFVPSHIGEYSDRMSFFERVGNTLLEGLLPRYMNTSTAHSQMFVPEKPPRDIKLHLENADLVLFLSDVSVSYPSPLMANTVQIGDIMARPAQPLPRDLHKFMDATNGVILMSLGSFIDHIPQDITEKFCSAFAQVKYQVVWKTTKSPSCELSSNVHIMSWVPQNDILAHPNLKLFITHAGINSVIESVNHAVPMIAVPISLDQPHNAHRVHSKDLGKKIKFSSFTTQELIQNINDIISDDTIKENLRLQSKILREKIDSPAKRASFWINHVIKYGGAHLRSGAYELSSLQFFMIDVYVFLLIAVLLTLSLILLGFLCCCKLFHRCMFGKTKKVKKE